MTAGDRSRKGSEPRDRPPVASAPCLARRTFFVETLGCPKNQVDSDKLVGTLLADGMAAVDDAEAADLVVVNTCAFIEEARQESIDTVLALADRKADGAELVVTGCLAERYGAELAEALPEVDAVAGFGVPVTLGRKPTVAPAAAQLRPAEPAPPAGRRAVGLREGGRGLRQGVRLLRHPELPWPAALAVDRPDPHRGRRAGRRRRAGDRAGRPGPRQLRPRPGGGHQVDRPAGRGGVGAGAVGAAPLPLPVRPHAAARRRGARHRRAVLRPVAPARVGPAGASHAPMGRRRPLPRPHRRHPRRRLPTPPSAPTSSSATRARPRPTTTSCWPSSTPPSSTGAASSPTRGRTAPTPPTSTASVPRPLVDERLAELRERQDAITAARRDDLVGTEVEVLVDAPGVARSHREAPEIDGIVVVPEALEVGHVPHRAHHRRRRPRQPRRAACCWPDR